MHAVRRATAAALLVMTVALVLGLSTHVFAHATEQVGEYLVIVGFATEPPFTDERNGLDLMVRRADTGEPVPFLEQTLNAEITSPDGASTRQLPLRARHGQEGRYTSDFLLTETGVYTIRIWGSIHGTDVDVSFETHEVRALEELRFP